MPVNRRLFSNAGASNEVGARLTATHCSRVSAVTVQPELIQPSKRGQQRGCNRRMEISIHPEVDSRRILLEDHSPAPRMTCDGSKSCTPSRQPLVHGSGCGEASVHLHGGCTRGEADVMSGHPSKSRWWWRPMNDTDSVVAAQCQASGSFLEEGKIHFWSRIRVAFRIQVKVARSCGCRTPTDSDRSPMLKSVLFTLRS
jgi:hypothetical protein